MPIVTEVLISTIAQPVWPEKWDRETMSLHFHYLMKVQKKRVKVKPNLCRLHRDLVAVFLCTFNFSFKFTQRGSNRVKMLSLQTWWGSCFCFSWWSICQNQAPQKTMQVTHTLIVIKFLIFPVYPGSPSSVKIHHSSLFARSSTGNCSGWIGSSKYKRCWLWSWDKQHFHIQVFKDSYPNLCLHSFVRFYFLQNVQGEFPHWRSAWRVRGWRLHRNESNPCLREGPNLHHDPGTVFQPNFAPRNPKYIMLQI